MLKWENTDQFGNLKVATSAATSSAELRAELVAMVEDVLTAHPTGAVFAVDAPFCEISAPSGDQVSHVLAVPLFESGLTMEDAQAMLQELVGDRAAVQGPWEDF